MPDILAPVEPKAAEILGNIRGVFAAKGFDGASMQDLARAAGMSAGNFYRYFPSKDAIVETMVAQDLAHVQAEFAQIMRSADPRETFREVLVRRLQTIAVEDDGPLWAEIEAASARREEIARISSRMHQEVVRHVSRVFARIAGLGEDDAPRFVAHATLIFMLVKGVAMQGCGHRAGPETAGPAAAKGFPEVEALVLRLVDQIIADVAAQPAPVSKAGR